MENQKTLMTEGPIWKILLRFAFPLILGNLFQQLYNAVDSLVVGNFCGDQALAAVTSSGSLCALIIGFFQGTFVGSSVLIARRYGAGDRDGTDKAVHTTVLFALGLGLLLSIFGVVFTPTILRWMDTPESVLDLSVSYFRIYSAGLLALVLYNTSNGIFQALGDSRHPLYYLFVASAVNVVLDLLFVAVFHWGVAGAALATVLAQLLSALLGFAYLMRGKFVVKLRLKGIFRPDWTTLGQIFKLGLPSGVQNSVISIANVVVQANINAFGDNAMGGCGSYFKIEGFAFLPIVSLTMAITTFVSQNLGAGKIDRVKACGKIGTILTMAMAEGLGVILILAAPFLIGLFSSTPEVISYGVTQVRVEAPFYFLLAGAYAAGAVLRGVGKTMTPMTIMLAVWCVFRIGYITFMVRWLQTIVVVFTAYPVTWGISCVIFALIFLRGKWLPRSAQVSSQIPAGI